MRSYHTKISAMLQGLMLFMLIICGSAYAMPGLNSDTTVTAETLGANSNDYVWWYMENPARRVTDGSMEVTLVLHLPKNAVPDFEPEVFFAVNTWNRNGRSLSYNEDMVIYTKKAVWEDGRYKLVLYSKTFQRFQVWAKVNLNGKPYYAQTVFNLFGDSQFSDPDAEVIGALPPTPQFVMKYGEAFFRAQIENPITVQLTNLGSGRPDSLTVFDQHGQLLEYVAGQGADYTYTPPYDKELMAAGSRGRNHVVLVAELPDNMGIISFYQPVYRSAGRRSLKGGLAVAGGTALVCFIPIWLVRRKFEFK